MRLENGLHRSFPVGLVHYYHSSKDCPNARRARIRHPSGGQVRACSKVLSQELIAVVNA